ncbi:pseudouridine synthase [Shewanella sp. AS1]|uniref:RluA family pseudouridine synthase n=1 Tax=Shewanella sp. AS1 TaxID=2907626 RepID=UPI001F1E51F3|nr:RluA family pseudouridine synthase [Shewanella sp. AS1]MCE9678222.1 pseudouridine synthase [Shewanella sp. AS1]
MIFDVPFINAQAINAQAINAQAAAPQDNASLTASYSRSHCFHPFSKQHQTAKLPARFTFPFYYDPHPLATLAVAELQHYLESQSQNQWQHNFGLEGELKGAIGKMFGVLVVKSPEGELGYLAAFSGKLAERNLINGFVPPVFDMLTQESFFHGEQRQINRLTQDLTKLEAAPELICLSEAWVAMSAQAETELETLRQQVVEARKDRKARRHAAVGLLSDAKVAELNLELGRESVLQKNQQKALKAEWDSKLAEIDAELKRRRDEIKALKKRRASQSKALQTKLFAQYQFVNRAGEVQDLNQLFRDAPSGQPPAGAGECAAPKLLQFAFENDFTPLAMAEFWWGASPKSEVKQHKQFYGACQGKCKPILGHMLKGIEMDEDPLLRNPAEGKTLEILYQDEAMLVVNKPSEFLSVPGKNIQDSVYSRIRQQFPEATGPLIVHRLDMSTSGLMVLALTSEANRALVQQFIGRSVEKRYLAKLAGQVQGDRGEIRLPLRVDLDDRPRQLVCETHGKPAHTLWQVKARDRENTWLYLYPQTGRTHQLRVHCAHQRGLGLPIIGDDLYGTKDTRLHLHAERLVLNHPITGERLTFEADAGF